MSPFATSLVLLALIWHAFLVSSTHIHRVQSSEDELAVASMGSSGGAEHAPPSGGHAQCLLCRLQRNFISDLQHTVPAIAAPATEAQGDAELPSPPASAAHLLLPSGRGPPLA
ncbi:MAG: hypothetical protein LC802_11740 [Acidobacteria bacterium]|nr:hypothetical protein [Acidobacteriota bacterium]